MLPKLKAFKNNKSILMRLMLMTMMLVSGRAMTTTMRTTTQRLLSFCFWILKLLKVFAKTTTTTTRTTATPASPTASSASSSTSTSKFPSIQTSKFFSLKFALLASLASLTSTPFTMAKLHNNSSTMLEFTAVDVPTTDFALILNNEFVKFKRNSATNMLPATTTRTSTSNILANFSTAANIAADFMATSIAQVLNTTIANNSNSKTTMPTLTNENSSITATLMPTLKSTRNSSSSSSSIPSSTATTWPTTLFFSTPTAAPNSPIPSSSPTTAINDTNFTMTFHQHCLSSRDSFADLITIILYTIVCIVGLFGNTLVIYVVLRFSKMQTVTNIYILNLAIADECFLIGIPFLLYTMRICSWTFGEYICKAYMVSTSITQFTSSIFLLIMSADRFIAVCHPISSPRYRTLHIAKMVSALAWLTSAVLMLPVILFASTVAQEDGQHFSCNIEWPEKYKKHSGTTFILYTFFLGFATPLCFILCFYYLVIKKLHAVGRKHKSKEKKRSHRKVTRLVLTVITVYILCWLPQWISQVALISSNPAQRDLSRWEVFIFLLLGCLAYSNSAMNPILYAFLSDNFRKSFSKAFTCMAGHEVNAQLQVEPSVFTKHGGSRRRSSAKRLVAQATSTTSKQKSQKKTKAAMQAAAAAAAKQQNPTASGNNNSSTTTSSTATRENEKQILVVGGTAAAVASGSSSGNQATGASGSSVAFGNFYEEANGVGAGVGGGGAAVAENVMLVLDKEESVCATVVERKNAGTRHQLQIQPTNLAHTLQTDL